MGRSAVVTLKIPMETAKYLMQLLAEQINGKEEKLEKRTNKINGINKETEYEKTSKIINNLFIKKCWKDSEILCTRFKVGLENLNRKGLDVSWFEIQRKIIAKSLHTYPEITMDIWISAINFFLNEKFFSKHITSFSVIIRNFHRFTEANKSTISNDIYNKFKQGVI